MPLSSVSTNESVIRGDAHAVWFRWLTEGICSPSRYIEESRTVTHVFADAKARIDFIYGATESLDKREEFANLVARYVMGEVHRLRNLKRVGASRALKMELLESAINDPRCWLCGYKFSSLAIDRFMGKSMDENIAGLNFVDVLRPRGLQGVDLSIQIEHVKPVSSGGAGGDNLALACGWCNRHKSAKTSLYDANMRSPRAGYRLGGETWYELPHPFWSVRIAAVRRQCEHIQGCSRTLDTDELFVSPVSKSGAPNPSNLKVYCREHDPYSAFRFQARTEVSRIWKDRKRH